MTGRIAAFAGRSGDRARPWVLPIGPIEEAINRRPRALRLSIESQPRPVCGAQVSRRPGACQPSPLLICAIKDHALACILLPQLALDAVLRGFVADSPGAVGADQRHAFQRRVLQTVNARSRAGITTGQSLAAAQMLSRYLHARYDSGADALWHGFLRPGLIAFSSHVSLHYPASFGDGGRIELRLVRPGSVSKHACGGTDGLGFFAIGLLAAQPGGGAYAGQYP